MAQERDLGVPPGFLWGAATAAHQVEGGNVGNDWWELENAVPPAVPHRSGDACDSYHRFAEDIGLVAGLGLNAYRFSLEWSRIEPEPGRHPGRHAAPLHAAPVVLARRALDAPGRRRDLRPLLRADPADRG